MVENLRLSPQKFILTVPQATLFAALGLAIQVAAYQLALSLHGSFAQALFFLGLLLEVLPLATVAAGNTTSRTSRVIAALIMSQILFVSQWLVQPYQLASFDELLHLTSLRHLVDGQVFFSSNTMLPISPYYPGLEAVTAGIHWVTGLPTLPAQLLVIVVAKALLVTSLFLVFERISRSTQAAGAAVVLYATSPPFYSFDAQYAYETLGLGLASVAALYVIRTLDRPISPPSSTQSGWGGFRTHALLHRFGLSVPGSHVGRRISRWKPAIAAGIALTALALTHHTTSFAALAGLVIVLVWLLAVRRYRQAKVVGAFVCFGAAVIGLWSTFVGGKLTAYLSPAIEQAASSLVEILLQRQPSKTLFVQPVGVVIPVWEIPSIGASVLLLAGLLVWATMSRDGWQMRRDRNVFTLLAVCNIGYIAIMAARLSPSATQFGTRSAAIVFAPMACYLGAWWVYSGGASRVRRTAISLALLGVLFAGGVALGTASYLRVPGPYLVGADQRSVDSYSVDAANWARGHLPAGVRVAADRHNSAVLAAFGNLQPVRYPSDFVNVGPIFFTPQTNETVTRVIRRGDVRLILVDRRLAQGLPYEGFYFEPGETDNARSGTDETEKITKVELNKFQHWPAARTVYRDGPVAIYDVSSVLGLPPVRVSREDKGSGDLDTTNWGFLGVFAALVIVGLATAGTRPPRGHADNIATMVGMMLGAVVVAGVLGTVIVITGVDPTVVAITVLAAGGGYFAKTRRFRQVSGLQRISTSGVLVSVGAASLVAASIAVAFAHT